MPPFQPAAGQVDPATIATPQAPVVEMPPSNTAGSSPVTGPDNSPAAWIAERATMQQQFDQQQQAQAARQAALEKELAAARAAAAGANAAAAKSTPPLEDVARSVGTRAATGALELIGVPPWLATLLAGTGALVLGRVVKRKFWPSQSAASKTTTTGDVEIPPQVVVDTRHHNLFSQVPKNDTDAAWAQAVATLTEKIPGAAAHLQMLVKIKDQLLKGQK
jgi:hypothetical protein